MGEWREDLHPRGPGGKFGSGGAGGKSSRPKASTKGAAAAKTKAKIQAAAIVAKAKIKVAQHRQRVGDQVEKLKAKIDKARGKAATATKASKAKIRDRVADLRMQIADVKADAKAKAAKIIADARVKADAKRGIVRPKSAPEFVPAKATVAHDRPKAASRPELDQHAKTAAHAMAEGDIVGARFAVMSKIGAMGLEARPERQYVRIASDAELGGAYAAHGWDGTIHISQTTADLLPKFGVALSDRTAESRSPEQEYAAHALVHETLHGYSPGSIEAYSHHGAQIEEITTEVAARFVSHDMFGIAKPATYDGAYGETIHTATKAIAELTGQSTDHAYRHLESAALRYKARGANSLDHPDDARDAFANDLAETIGHRDSDVAAALAKHLKWST